MEMETVLTDKRRQVQRISNTAKLKLYFDEKWDRSKVLEEDTGKKKSAKTESDPQSDWLRQAFISLLGPNEKPCAWEKALYDASFRVCKLQSANLDAVHAVKGGHLLTSSIDNFQDVDTKSYRRDAGHLLWYALEEYVIVRRFREPLLESSPTVRSIRRSLTTMLNVFQMVRNEIKDGMTVPVQTEWVWPDQLVDKKEDSKAPTVSFDDLEAEWNRNQMVLKAQNEITTMVRSLENNNLLRLHGTTAITQDVKTKLDEFVKVSWCLRRECLSVTTTRP
jgi:hypothetical protein